MDGRCLCIRVQCMDTGWGQFGWMTLSVRGQRQDYRSAHSKVGGITIVSIGKMLVLYARRKVSPIAETMHTPWVSIHMTILMQSADALQLSLLRLSHGSYGRVEVYYSGQWGTVCDDYWSIEDANVVCRELGYGRAKNAYPGARYGAGSGPIWMDMVQCKGSQRQLSSCSFRGWGIHGCGHEEDASVVCSMPGELSVPEIVHL